MVKVRAMTNTPNSPIDTEGYLKQRGYSPERQDSPLNDDDDEQDG